MSSCPSLTASCQNQKRTILQHLQKYCPAFVLPVYLVDLWKHSKIKILKQWSPILQWGTSMLIWVPSQMSSCCLLSFSTFKFLELNQGCKDGWRNSRSSFLSKTVSWAHKILIKWHEATGISMVEGGSCFEEMHKNESGSSQRDSCQFNSEHFPTFQQGKRFDHSDIRLCFYASPNRVSFDGFRPYREHFCVRWGVSQSI